MSPDTPAPAEPPVPVSLSPELLAWARQTFDMEECLAGIREIEETGGHTLESVIAEIEAAAGV